MGSAYSDIPLAGFQWLSLDSWCLAYVFCLQILQESILFN